MNQAKIAQQYAIAKSKTEQIPEQTNVPIQLNPTWMMQGNVQFQNARNAQSASTFGTQMQEAARERDLQAAIDAQNAMKATKEAEEDAIVPPSLEELGGEIPQDLDAYINYVESQTVLNGVELVGDEEGSAIITNPVATEQTITVREATKASTEDKLYAMTLKALKQEYKRIGGKQSVSNIMNKAKMVNLILAHKGMTNGTQSEETEE